MAAGLVVTERWDYIFRAGREPHIATLVCARKEDLDGPPERRTGSLIVRGFDGEWTEEYLSFREDVASLQR